MTHSSPSGGQTIAEKEIPDAQQRVEGQVTRKETHQPVSGEHEGFHSVVLQVSVSSRTHPFQDPGQHGCVEQDSLLQQHICRDSSNNPNKNLFCESIIS